MNNLKIISIDYVPSENCKNIKATDLCLKCSKCGRKFKNGMLVENLNKRRKNEKKNKS